MGRKTSSQLLMQFIKAEVTRGYQLEMEEERFQARREKVYMFMTIPKELEKLMGYGFFQCADAFLFVFTFLPIRVAFKLFSILCNFVKHPIKRFLQADVSPLLKAGDKCDILKLFIFFTTAYIFTYIDTSVLYHVIKSQSVIKLYIFFNMLEVGDRLFASFVQDTIDALLITATEDNSKKSKSNYISMGLKAHVFLTTFVTFGHAMVILLQATTLSVAINASNRALLTVMMSNNFVELKGAVFKKFDKMNLFQVACSDIRERFHLFVLLLVVCLQTMREYSWEESRFWVLFPDCLMVFLAEIGVDWVKHAFITRFNEVPAEVYREYTLSLAYDLCQTKQRRAFSDHADMIGRRLGFVPLPLAIVLFRVLRPCVNTADAPTIILAVLAIVALGSFRILSSIILLGKACDLIDQHMVASGVSASTPTHLPTSQSLQAQIPAPDTVKSEPIGTVDSCSRTPSPSPQYLLINHDKVLQIENKTSTTTKIKFPRSYSASHTPRPSIGSINEIQTLPPLPADYNDDSKLLPANSLVSILSVNLNEEMQKVGQPEIGTEVTSVPSGGDAPQKITRKHSLGSNLVDSEDVLLAQKKLEENLETVKIEPTILDQSSEDSFICFGSNKAVDNTALELENLSLNDSQEIKASNDSLSAKAIEKIADEIDKNLEPGKSSFSAADPADSSTNQVKQRTKKKSITGWFKELSSSH